MENNNTQKKIISLADARTKYKQMSRVRVYESDREVAESINYKPIDARARKRYANCEFAVRNS